MSYLSGLDLNALSASPPLVEEDHFYISPEQIKPPTADRAEEVRQLVGDGTKLRNQFVCAKDYVEYLVEYLREKAGTDFNWPMSIIVRLADLKALEVTGFISKKELEQYITH